MSGRAGGLVLVDKPVGPSSFAVVREQRRRHGLKAGHAGTLDPAASGLLLVLLGSCTRLARYLVGLDKRYVTRILLGVRTSTGDAEGEPVAETEIPADLETSLQRLRGTVELPVPAASAVKIGGERAYRLHRRGVEVEMPVRTSEVYEARIASVELPELELELHVSSGTYIRAIADALGGHCRSLRRTTVGPFRVEDAGDEILGPRAALPHLPEVELSDAALVRVRSGRPVAAGGEGPARLVHAGRLVAVGRIGDGVARPETVLPW